jgi:hypothetical protein
MPGRVDVRVKDNIINSLKDLEKRLDITRADLVRELLEIGIIVKQRQLSDKENKRDNWKEYYKDIAFKIDVHNQLIKELCSAVHGPADFNKSLKRAEENARKNRTSFMKEK